MPAKNQKCMKAIKKLLYQGRFFFIMGMVAFILAGCNHEKKPSPAPPEPPNPPDTPATNDVDCWLTKRDETVKLQKQNTVLAFGTAANQYPDIDINEATTYQSVDGFGYTLTGGSAEVINTLSASVKQQLLQELFGTGDASVHISYLRISIGASDLNKAPFTYDDMPAGETDVNLDHFSLEPDEANVISLLKEILAVAPDIKILSTPWSAPVWMKDNSSFVGGSLQPQYYAVYARYFVKYIQEMKARGITIDAVTPQNEPLHPGNNPSMLMSALQQADFIKNHLGPAFRDAGINTKIIIYDHNCDQPEYPVTVLNDAAARAFIDGSAFHLYAGNISALSVVHAAYPDKALYFTEQYTASTGNFGDDLLWHVKNVVIGSMQNWSRNALEWNLANDPYFGPHTDGGCNTCKGAITIQGSSSYNRNVSYYIIAHASKFIPPGSRRIFSTAVAGLSNVTFTTPEGKKVLLAENDGNSKVTFNIKYNNKWVTTSLEAGSVATYIWK